MGMEHEEMVPVLRKTDSYQRTDKPDRTHIVPKMLARRQGSGGTMKKNRVSTRDSVRQSQRLSLSKRLSLGRLFKAVGSPAKPRGGELVGRWESDSVDGMDGFLEELGVSERYKRLTAVHGGSTVRTLAVSHEGDRFEIVDNNERRAVTMSFQIGVPFYAENERGQGMTCVASWEGEEGGVLLVRAETHEPSGKAESEILVRREVREGQLLEEVHVVRGPNRGTGEAKRVRRVYNRLP